MYSIGKQLNQSFGTNLSLTDDSSARSSPPQHSESKDHPSVISRSGNSILPFLNTGAFYSRDIMTNLNKDAGEMGPKTPHHSQPATNLAISRKAVPSNKRNVASLREVREVDRKSRCVVNAERITPLTTKQEQETQMENYLISRFIRLIRILGRRPELVELYNAGFTREEIDLMEWLTDGWLTEPHYGEQYVPRN